MSFTAQQIELVQTLLSRFNLEDNGNALTIKPNKLVLFDRYEIVEFNSSKGPTYSCMDHMGRLWPDKSFGDAVADLFTHIHNTIIWDIIEDHEGQWAARTESEQQAREVF